MTISLTGNRLNRGRAGLPYLRPKAAGGFTIVELMVVMLIMLLLLVVLVPTVQKIQRNVMRVGALTTIRLIEGACKKYYEDFGEYPPSKDDTNYSGWEGKELLVLFLTGYGPDLNSDGTPGSNFSTDDGCESFGFRIEKRGLKFGPYNGAEKVKTKLVGGRQVFVDSSFDEEIYYFRFDSVLDTYYTADNSTPPGLSGGSAYADYLTNAKSMQTDFILTAAGPDGVFQGWDDWLDTDDTTNFLEEQH